MTPETQTPVERVSDLDGLEALARAATPGEVRFDRLGSNVTLWIGDLLLATMGTGQGIRQKEANARFILAAVNALPDLITRLRAAEAATAAAVERAERAERLLMRVRSMSDTAAYNLNQAGITIDTADVCRVLDEITRLTLPTPVAGEAK